MPQRTRVLTVVMTATTDDADFLDPEDLSEVATLVEGALSRSVESLQDLTLYAITPDDGPNSDVWDAIQHEAQRQLKGLAENATRKDDWELIATITATVDDARRAYQQALARHRAQDEGDVDAILNAYKTLAAARRQLRRFLDTPHLSPALAERIRINGTRLQRWSEDLVRSLNISF